MKTYGHGGDIYSFANRPIDFSSNINPLGMSPIVEQAIKENVANFAIYPDYSSRKLVEAIAINHNVGQHFISLGNGAADLIYRLCISQKPEKALVIAPSFSEYEEALNLVNAQISYYNLGQNLSIKEDILGSIENMDMVFVCNPNNPTGLLVEENVLLNLANKVKNTKTILVIDECFLDFSTKGKTMIDYIKTNPNIVILKAFTKFYALAGIRLGYTLSSNASLNEKLEKYAPPWNISAVAQLAGVEALKDEEYKQKTKIYVEKERNFLIEQLRNMGLKVYESQGNYVLFYYEKKELVSKLLTKNILIRDCSNYKNLEKGHYRIAVRNHEDNIKLVEAMKEVMCYGKKNNDSGNNI